MTDKAELIKARDDMLAVLDEKFKSLPEWRAFRIMDKAIMALDERTPVKTETNGADESSAITRYRARPSYSDLAVEFIQQLKRPASTTEVVSHIAKLRNRDAGEIRINIQSALSRDERIESVHWSGGRGWWFVGRQVPA